MSSQDNINYMKEKVEDLYDWLNEGLHMVYDKLKVGVKWIWKKVKVSSKRLKFWNRRVKAKIMKVHNEQLVATGFGYIYTFIEYTQARLKNGDFTLREMKLYLDKLKTIHTNEVKMKSVMDLLEAKIKAWSTATVSP